MKALGDSTLKFDLSALGTKGHSDVKNLERCWNALLQSLKDRESGFYDAPIDPEISQIQETIKKAKALLEGNQFKKCIFIGIGGSYLGPKLITDCFEKYGKTLEFLYCENPDATQWEKTIAQCRPEETLLCVATKSGGTFETLALALLGFQWLGEKRLSSHVLFLTDPLKGELRQLASEKNIQSLSIASDVGGRYSIFTPIGLLPLCLLGGDSEAFLEGAKRVRSYCESVPAKENLIALLAEKLVQQSSRTTHVMMPYSTRLKTFSDWWAQLWAESLGKNNLGYNPVTSYGPAHQHSLLQLINEGVDDKIVCFIHVGEKSSTKIPHLSDLKKSYPTIDLLSHCTLEKLMTSEYKATADVLTSLSRPSFRISLDELNELSLGALCYTFCILTALTGKLLEINPFDQPGVEAGKKLIHQSLQNLK